MKKLFVGIGLMFASGIFAMIASATGGNLFGVTIWAVGMMLACFGIGLGSIFSFLAEVFDW